jgi:DNA helicase-2/ATP-dependent DNA helicase PcrA
MSFVPSKYQTAIFGEIGAERDNLIVEAVAGSGKSTTIMEAISRMKGFVLTVAFSKAIATELQKKLVTRGSSARASTIHSLAYGAVTRTLKAQVDDRKGRQLVSEVYGDNSYESRVERGLIERLVSLCKLTLTEPTVGNLTALVDHYGLDMDVESVEDIFGCVPIVLRLAKERTATVDFDDMVWLAVELDLPIPRHDWVLVDEAQDLNAVQREVVMRATDRDGHVVAVGDSRQAIYGFAGADTASIQTLTGKLSAKVMPLSICYRCPKSHLDLARSIVPQIEARPDAPEGEIVQTTADEALRAMRDEDLVICRMNAPLATLAMKLIRSGRKCSIKGRDIGSGLLSLMDRWMRGTSLAEGVGRLMDYLDRESAKLEKAGRERQLESLRDRVDTVLAISDGCHTVADARARVEAIFTDNPTAGVTLSSVHRAKGLEANRVMIYKPELLDWKRRGSAEWEVAQGENLKYVALTRAKSELWMVADRR